MTVKTKDMPTVSSQKARRSTATDVFLTVMTAVVCISSTSCATSQPKYTYPFSFFNLSTSEDTEENSIGIVEIYACSLNSGEIFLSLGQSTYDQFASAVYNGADVINQTLDNSLLKLSGQPAGPGNATTFPYGFMVSALGETFVYGIKADQGTTDGYLISVLTNNSKEFFIAGWTATFVNSPYNQYSGLMVMAAFGDTCVEVWQVKPVTTLDNTTGSNVTTLTYSYLTGFFMHDQYWFGQLTAETDPTGLYINASRPVTVISGVSCGNVPMSTQFCDHMAEVLPAVSELGRIHVVPPILGRSKYAGYIVRVVPAKLNTVVTWSSQDPLGAQGGPVVVHPGSFQEIDSILTSTAMLIQCSELCVVMQYNKGCRAVANEEAFTDPFMTLITPVERYVSQSCFGTAVMSLDRGVNVNFDNWLSLVTANGNEGAIFVDGNSVQSTLWNKFGNYSIASWQITHGFHSITTAAGSSATFGGWVYGHSLASKSTSAYGYPIGYRTVGNMTEDTWSQAVAASQTSTATVRNSVCQRQIAADGLAVTEYQYSQFVLYYPIRLDATLRTRLKTTSSCRAAYLTAIRGVMRSVVRFINYQLCMQSMCPYLAESSSGGGVIDAGDVTTGVEPTAMFAAINASSLESNINLDMNNGVLTTVHIIFQYAGNSDANAEKFGRCRAEIRDFLMPFVNWMTLINNGYSPASASTLSNQASLSQQQQQMIADNQFFEAPTSCPALSFTSASFAYSQNQC